MRIKDFFRKIFFYFSKLIRRNKFPVLDKYTKEYITYFNHLFARASNANGFDFLCTILRVEGITSGHWDAFVEAEEALMDFSKVLRKISRKKHSKRALRLALFLYCHSTEMSAPYEIIANLLSCCQSKSYRMYPFSELVKVIQKEGTFPERKLPSPVKKVKYIKQLADNCGESRIVEIIESFFHPELRNAFYHSDYAISEDEFRIIQGRKIGDEVISLEKLSEILTKCFAFYSAFFIAYNRTKKDLALEKKFHRWPNYEVLEILSDKDGLTGFKVHFPNNTSAFFERKKYKGTMGMNLGPENEGISLFIGDIESYKKAEDWFVNGKPFDEFGTRYNKYGYWKPIIFRGNSDRIQSKAVDMTEDKIVQGCLFYIFSTGHKSIEFTIKSKEKLFGRDEYSRPLFGKNKNFVIKNLGINSNGIYLYDGSVYLDLVDVKSVKGGIKKINSCIDNFKKIDPHLVSCLKYQLYHSAAPQKNSNGTFSIVLSMDSPRGTLVASDLAIFPKQDWKIKEEWIY